MGPSALARLVCALAALRSCNHFRFVKLSGNSTSGWSLDTMRQISYRTVRVCQRSTSFPLPLPLTSYVAAPKSIYPEVNKWQFIDTLFVADLRPARAVAAWREKNEAWEHMSRLPWLLITDAASHQQALRDLTWRPDNRVILLRLGENDASFSEAYHIPGTTSQAVVTQLGAVDPVSLTMEMKTELAEDPWERRKNLTGFILRCSIYPRGQYAIITTAADGTIHIGGMMGDIFDFLQLSLNLRVKGHIPKDATPGASATGDYTGVLGDVYEGRADVAAPFYYRLLERENAFDFSDTIMNTWQSLVLRRPKKFQGSTNYTNEFHWSAWGAIVFIFLVSVLILKMVVKISNNQENISLSSCFMTNFKLFCNMGQERDMAHSLPYRLWLLTVLVCVMVLHVSYSSSLITLLTTYKLVLPFDNLQGLYRARHQFTLGLQKNSFMEQIMMSETKSLLGDVYRDMVLQHPELHGDFDFLYQRLLQDRSFTMFFAKNDPLEDCRILRLPPRYFVFPAAFPIQRGLSVLPILNIQFKKMRTSGVLMRLFRKWGLEGRSTPCPGVPTTPLGLEETYTAISLLALGLVASVLFLLAECALARVCRLARERDDL